MDRRHNLLGSSWELHIPLLDVDKQAEAFNRVFRACQQTINRVTVNDLALQLYSVVSTALQYSIYSTVLCFVVGLRRMVWNGTT